MLRISASFSIQSQAAWQTKMPKLTVITLALALDEVKTRLFQVADEFSDFAGHGEGKLE
jgi:hypothetical protein